MKMHITETTEKDIKYFCANLGVRYYEDADINGEEDISFEEQREGAKPRVPLVFGNPDARHIDEKWRWIIKIDVETGNIKDWPEGVTANIHYKVCDDGTYWLEDESGEKYHEIDSYVPQILDFDRESYGDYVIMTIDGSGHVEEWWDKSKIERELESFFMEEGF